MDTSHPPPGTGNPVESLCLSGTCAALALGEAPGAPVRGGGHCRVPPSPRCTWGRTLCRAPSKHSTQLSVPTLPPHTGPSARSPGGCGGQSQGGAWVGPGSPSVTPPRAPATCGCEPRGVPAVFSSRHYPRLVGGGGETVVVPARVGLGGRLSSGCDTRRHSALHAGPQSSAAGQGQSPVSSTGHSARLTGTCWGPQSQRSGGAKGKSQQQASPQPAPTPPLPVPFQAGLPPPDSLHRQ